MDYILASIIDYILAMQMVWCVFWLSGGKKEAYNNKVLYKCKANSDPKY